MFGRFSLKIRFLTLVDVILYRKIGSLFFLGECSFPSETNYSASWELLRKASLLGLKVKPFEKASLLK